MEKRKILGLGVEVTTFIAAPAPLLWRSSASESRIHHESRHFSSKPYNCEYDLLILPSFISSTQNTAKHFNYKIACIIINCVDGIGEFYDVSLLRTEYFRYYWT